MALAEFLKGAANLKCIELLKYNHLAGAKYKLLGLNYQEDFCQADEEEYRLAEEVFSSYNLPLICER